MIYLDSIFSIGKEHKVCEDYVLTDNSIIPFIVVSDGRSSSDHTDIGSCLISIQTKNFILKNYKIIKNNPEYIKDVFKNSSLFKNMLEINEESLDCTLLTAFVFENKLYYFVIGDGIINYKQNGIITTKNFSFEGENVFYGNYFNNISCLEIYKSKKLKLDIETISLNKNIDVNKESTSNFIYFDSLDIENLDYFFLSTDGLLSCSTNNVLSKKYYSDFLSFKNLKGEFLQRRYKNWIKNLNKEGISHLDDVGIAGFSFFNEDNNL